MEHSGWWLFMYYDHVLRSLGFERRPGCSSYRILRYDPTVPKSEHWRYP